MTSFTVAFTGRSSVLQANFFPEIVLDANANYSCALLDFSTYNSIANIIEGKNNEFKFKNNVNNDEISIALPTSMYEVEDILKYLKSELIAHNISLRYDISEASSTVQISFDTDITWTGGNILNVIGFSGGDNSNFKTFEKGEQYRSDHIVKISDIDVIRIECDIVSGSYINGKHCHTIHQFSNCKVPPGYKFIEIPHHIIYLPIKTRELQSIQISVVDQDGNLIDFRGEQISCRIHIKKIESTC